jgi:phage terminase large subunit-like protein
MKWNADNSFLLEYRERIESGEIPAGMDMRMELDNLMEDMKSGEYGFNRKDALIRIDFIENCVKLTKSPFYGQPMQLMLWQKAMIEAVYSFKMEDGTDRFQEILLLIARKNGKTETVAALQFAEMIIGGVGLDIVCSGTNDGTADLAYSTIDTMRTIVDPKNKDTWRNQKGMKCFDTNNHIYKLSDSSKQKEGRSIDIAGIDEVWSLTDDGIYKPIQQSTSTKDRYKIFMFGSEGFINDGFLDKKRKEYEAIIRGEDDTDAARRKLPWLYTQDSEMEVWDTDAEGISRSWMKSNPSLGTVKKWSYLKDRVQEARASKGDRIFVLSKDYNIKTAGAESWLNLEDYNYDCEFSPEELRGCAALGAVDLAETTDLCAAKVMVMKPDDPRKYIISHYFIPEGKLEEHDDKGAGAKYQEWAEAGLLTITDGADIDLSVVADWFYSLYADYGIRMWKCGYDQRFAKDWIARMDYYGWQRGSGDNSDLIMILQNAQTLSNAIRTAEADFKHKLIWYGNNEMDRWNFGNAGIAVDKRGQALIVKMETERRIDGAVCLAILYETFRRYRTDYRQMVEGN